MKIYKLTEIKKDLLENGNIITSKYKNKLFEVWKNENNLYCYKCLDSNSIQGFNYSSIHDILEDIKDNIESLGD